MNHRKIKQAHEQYRAMSEAMEGKSELIRKLAKDHNAQLWDPTMNHEQLTTNIKLYASLVAAFIFTALTTLFAWITRGCEIAENFFEKQTDKYRR